MTLPHFRWNSVRTRLALWNVGVLALVLIVLGLALRGVMQITGEATVNQHLAHVAHVIQGRFEHETLPPPPNRTPPRPENNAGPFGQFRPRLFDLQGHALLPFSSDTPFDQTAFALGLHGQTTYSTVWAHGEQVRVLTAPMRKNGQIRAVAQVVQPLTDLNREVFRVTRTLLTLLPVGLLIAALGGAFLTDRALRPVREITQTASRIEAQNLSGRLTVTGNDEFSDLAATFNGMLGRLESAFSRLGQAYEQQRRFTADASHELRTPLTIIKAHSSLALSSQHTNAEYRQALEAIDRAADRTNHIVQDLLLLARVDAGQWELKLEPVRILGILEEAAEIISLQAHPALHWEIASPALCVLGNREALVRLFGNLLINAVRHTPLDGQITVSAQVCEETVIISVSDNGEGIAPEHLAHVFERFYRADTARARAEGGTGLGLAICQSIAEAHQGHLSIVSQMGEGTEVSLTLVQAKEIADTDLPLPALAAKH